MGQVNETGQSTKDCISRAAAIHTICAECHDGMCDMCSCEEIKALEALPSAQPERKTGKWIEKDVTCIDDELDDRNVIDEWQAAKCSVCGKWHTTPYLYSFKKYAYCPNCGARMEI